MGYRYLSRDQILLVSNLNLDSKKARAKVSKSTKFTGKLNGIPSLQKIL